MRDVCFELTQTANVPYTEKEVKNKQHEKKGKQRKVIRLIWIHTMEEKCAGSGRRWGGTKRNEIQIQIEYENVPRKIP